VVHGTQGSLVLHGLDSQEKTLKEGLRPGAPGWQPEGSEAWLYRFKQPPEPIFVEAGDYRRYYEGVRDAIRGQGPNPVPPEQAVRLMELLEAAHISALERREVALEGQV
jgi:predicted dehydrogenase